jgi:hypothetical protein
MLEDFLMDYISDDYRNYWEFSEEMKGISEENRKKIEDEFYDEIGNVVDDIIDSMYKEIEEYNKKHNKNIDIDNEDIYYLIIYYFSGDLKMTENMKKMDKEDIENLSNIFGDIVNDESNVFIGRLIKKYKK